MKVGSAKFFFKGTISMVKGMFSLQARNKKERQVGAAIKMKDISLNIMVDTASKKIKTAQATATITAKLGAKSAKGSVVIKFAGSSVAFTAVIMMKQVKL